MTLEGIEEELALYVPDNSLATYFKSWINSSVCEIANDFSLPALRLNEPTVLTVTESDWLYDLPATYMKKLFKCYDSDWNKITIKRSLDDIDALDIDHDDTNDHVTHVSVRDTKIGIYPMAAEDIKLWFYKKPTDLADADDELTCIPSQYHSRVVISKVIIKNYQLLMGIGAKLSERSLIWWKNNYRAGLYGEVGGDIGMINCLARDRKVSRRGGQDPLP